MLLHLLQLDAQIGIASDDVLNEFNYKETIRLRLKLENVDYPLLKKIIQFLI